MQESKKVDFHPWPRLWARYIDIMICGLLLVVLVPTSWNLKVTAINIIAIYLWMLIEPFFISQFGTTFGKALLGIKVSDASGKNLSLEAAFMRSARVLFYGLALGLPFIKLYFFYKEYKRLESNGVTTWDSLGECNVTQAKLNYKNIIGSILVYAFIMIATFLTWPEMQSISSQHLNARMIVQDIKNENKVYQLLDKFDPKLIPRTELYIEKILHNPENNINIDDIKWIVRSKFISPALYKYLSSSSDDAIITYVDKRLNSLEYVQRTDPNLVIVLELNLSYTKYLKFHKDQTTLISSDDFDKLLTAFTEPEYDLLISSRTISYVAPITSKAQKDLQLIIDNLSKKYPRDDVVSTFNKDTWLIPPKNADDIIIDFYREIKNLDPSSKANLIRYIFIIQANQPLTLDLVNAINNFLILGLYPIKITSLND